VPSRAARAYRGLPTIVTRIWLVPWPSMCELMALVAWALFVVDYVALLALSRDRAAFVRGHLFDLAVVALPLLRPLRLLRLVTLLSVLNRNVARSMRGRVAVYGAGPTSLVLFIASLAVLDAERGAKGATITTIGDALWWAFTTVMTVGYGDRYPITTEGRFIAAGLMPAGMALLGIVTASLASWLINKVREVDEQTQAATRADVAALTTEVRALRQDLDPRCPRGGPSTLQRVCARHRKEHPDRPKRRALDQLSTWAEPRPARWVERHGAPTERP
jgi:voltage-gated potassium channel